MENNLIDRQAAIDALDGNVIVTSKESAQAVMDYIRGCADRMRSLPSAQPELIEKTAYIRGFEQGRTQGMIDTKAEEVAQTNLQPTCNQLATDTISRQAAIDALGDEPYVWTEKDEYAMGLNNQWHYDKNAIKAVPSAQPDLDSTYTEGYTQAEAKYRKMWDEMPKIIRCRECKYWRQQTNYQGALLSFGYCESEDMWKSLYGETTEVAHIDTDDNHYCGYAERRTDEAD